MSPLRETRTDRPTRISNLWTDRNETNLEQVKSESLSDLRSIRSPSNSSRVFLINRDFHFDRQLDRHSFHSRDIRLIVDNFYFIGRITPVNNSHGVLVQDDNKCQDRDEHSLVPGRLIARDSSRKGLSPPARLKNDVRQQQVRIPFLRVPSFFR